jgi:hypothetical protein
MIFFGVNIKFLEIVLKLVRVFYSINTYILKNSVL